MKPLPIKRNAFRRANNVYYIGIVGEFDKRAEPANVCNLVFRKLLQIQSYCNKYQKPIQVLVDSSTVPSYVHSILNTSRIPYLSIVKTETDAKYGDFLIVENPVDFISKHVDVVLCVKEKESEIEVNVEGETALVDIVYTVRPLAQDKITPDPNKVVDDFKQPKLNKPTDDPYANMELKELYTREPYNYMEKLMDEMPSVDSNGTQAIPNNVF